MSVDIHEKSWIRGESKKTILLILCSLVAIR